MVSAWQSKERKALINVTLKLFSSGKRKRSPAADGNVIPLQRTLVSSTRDDELHPISAEDYDDSIGKLLTIIDTYSPGYD